ncbi:FHA domain-containing protein [Arthrobacter sp. BHU FT2]|nr:FHA domain-containing protein [Arthrobacter sp. BHU FT2]
MTLHCTLTSAVDPGLGARPLELTIEAQDGASGEDIQRQLEVRFGVGDCTVEGRSLTSLVAGRHPLVTGAVIVDGASARRSRRTVPERGHGPQHGGLALAVHSGSGAGTVTILARGTYTIGRSGTRIVIPDAGISRQHALLTVTDTGIHLEDLDSSNGTWVDGQRIRSAVVSTASRICCGNSAMSLVFTDDAQDVPAEAGTSVAEPIRIACRLDPGNRGVLLLTATLPLAIGIGLAVLTGMWMFLAFAGASAVSVLIPLLTARRQRRETAAVIRDAVRQDKGRRRRAGPSLAELTLGAAHLDGPPAGAPEGGAWLRLGLGLQPANIRVEPPGAAPPGVTAGIVPLLLEPSRRETIFQGTRQELDGMVRALIMQLAGYPCASSIRVVAHGLPHRLPLPARFLPRVTLTSTVDACRRLLTQPPPPGCGHGVLILTGTTADADGLLAAAGAHHGWQVLTFTTQDGDGAPPAVELSGACSTFRQGESSVPFVPDLAPPEVFDAFCRVRAAGSGGGPANRPLPGGCALGDILDLSAAGTAARWKASRLSSGLAAPLGLAAGGAIRGWDADGDGPHLLVAGTTGSGKSELLRSLVVSLAMSHPPDHVNFLFVDFKGGSGLGPLAGLVHCVGLLTDLAADGLERTLVSLRAEIRFREQAMGAANVPDLATYQSDRAGGQAAIPHLIIVIDEFRMLVDDQPEVLRELMRIAAIGRSLGIHLVMATQRPQGALTADIRANVTSSIALRVQSDMESLDIIGTKDAAGIPVERPGRAYASRGLELPQEFQAASLSAPGTRAADEVVAVQLATEYLANTGGDPAAGKAPTPAQAASPLVDLVRGLWAASGGALPRKPVAAPLPLTLSEPRPVIAGATAPAGAGSTPVWSLDLGAVDLPHQQRVAALEWQPVIHGHLALIGSPASGADETLELAVRLVLSHPHEAHCYLLDATGTLQDAAGHPRTGAHVGIQELRRAARVLERLAHEVKQRINRPSGSTVPLLVAVTGWGSWISAFRSGPLAGAEDLVQDLVRDGQRAGITVAISGERELATARFGGSLPNRLYFPAGSNEDSRLSWPRMPATAHVKGRAVAFGALVGPEPVACQIYSGAPSSDQQPPSMAGADAVPRGRRPFRVQALPSRVTVAEVKTAASAGAPVVKGRSQLPGPAVLLGLGGDELDPVRLPLPTAGVFCILGHARSGKTASLRALQKLNPGIRWLSPTTEDPHTFWQSVRSDAAAGRLPADAVMVADDADRLPPAALADLAGLQSLGHAVVVTAGYSPLLIQRVPLVLDARTRGTGLLLAPRSAADGDLFGLRVETEPGPPPGRAVLLSAGESLPLQVAWSPPTR